MHIPQEKAEGENTHGLPIVACSSLKWLFDVLRFCVRNARIRRSIDTHIYHLLFPFMFHFLRNFIRKNRRTFVLMAIFGFIFFLTGQYTAFHGLFVF